MACDARAIDASQDTLIRIEILDRLAFGTINFSLLKLGQDGADDVERYIILQLKNIFKRAIKFVRPYMSATHSINQLPRDPKFSGPFSNATLK